MLLTKGLYSFSPANAVVFAQYFLIAFELPITAYGQTTVALGVIIVSAASGFYRSSQTACLLPFLSCGRFDQVVVTSSEFSHHLEAAVLIVVRCVISLSEYETYP